MKKKNKFYILIGVIIIVILITSFLIWWNYKKTVDKKYQACLEKCGFEAQTMEYKSALIRLLQYETRVNSCKAECRENYGRK